MSIFPEIASNPNEKSAGETFRKTGGASRQNSLPVAASYLLSFPLVMAYR
jgi:hypothetical protein